MNHVSLTTQMESRGISVSSHEVSGNVDWSAARAAMLLAPNVTQLNAGSFGAHSRPVFERVTELRRDFASSPTDFFVRQAPPLLWHARERLAQLLHSTTQTHPSPANVSVGINIVASGLRLNSPGEILMTDYEYGAMQWCMERAAVRQGLTVRTFPLPTMPRDPQEIVDAATRAMSAKTRVLFFSHVLSPTGLVLPARELCDAARRRGIISIVDGAHAPGMLPLDLDSISADYYAGNCHKWLFAPVGAGFLAIGAGNEGKLQPLQASWGYHPDSYMLGKVIPSRDPDERDPYGSTQRIRFLEFEATRDICPWLALPAAIDFQTGLGWDAVRDCSTQLARYSHVAVGEGLKLELAVPADRRFSAFMTTFELPPGTNPIRLREHLWAARVEIPVIERPDRVMIRISHPFFTLESEIDRLVEVLQEFWK